MEECKICREIHGPDRSTNFDGFGVNSCGIYKSRIATLNPLYYSHGSTFAAAPELLAALKEILQHCVMPAGFPDKNKGRTGAQQTAYDQARAAIRKAEGGAE